MSDEKILHTKLTITEPFTITGEPGYRFTIAGTTDVLERLDHELGHLHLCCGLPPLLQALWHELPTGDEDTKPYTENPGGMHRHAQQGEESV